MKLDQESPSARLPQHKRRLFRAILLFGLIVVLFLMAVGAEFSARNYERKRTTAPDYFPSIFYPHRRLRYGLVPGYDYFGWFRINSLGFRGREFTVKKAPGMLRIICLGASTTFDTGSVGPNLPWPEVLEADLRKRLNLTNLEVLNMAIPGSTSLDTLIDLQMRVLRMEPDLLLIYQGHNDFIYSIPGPRAAPPSELFPLEDRPRSSIERWLTLHSLLYAKTEGRIVDMFDRIVNLAPFARVPEGPLQNQGPAIDEGFAAFRDNLRSIAAITTLNQIRLVLPQVIVPFSTDGGANAPCHLCDSLTDAYGNLPIEQVRANFERYNQVLAGLNAEPQVQYIPTDGFVPADDRYYHDPVHFGPEGSVLMGQKMGEALAPIIGDVVARRGEAGPVEARAKGPATR